MSEDPTDPATLAARLDAVERALTDDGRPSSPRPETTAEGASPADTDPRADAGARHDAGSPTDADSHSDAGARRSSRDAPDAETDLERSVEELDARVTELTAQLDAVRGLLDGVRAVDESVERRADLALATAERLASERDAEGLIAERLPTDDADAADADRPGDRSDGGDDGGSRADSLGARLREAL